MLGWSTQHKTNKSKEDNTITSEETGVKAPIRTNGIIIKLADGRESQDKTTECTE